MNESVSNQKNLPPAESSFLLVILWVTLTLYLYGFYWLDKQSSKLRQQFGVVPFDERFIKYGYILYALIFMLPLWVEHMQITNTTILFIAILPGPIMLLMLWYCCLRYASTVSKILGNKKTDILVLLGAFLFNVIYLNSWQNQNAGKQSKLSVNSN